MALGSTESLRVFPPCEMQGYSRLRKLQSFLKMDFFFFFKVEGYHCIALSGLEFPDMLLPQPLGVLGLQECTPCLDKTDFQETFFL